jgi:hypothetical protein
MASWVCPKCGEETYEGFARCSTPSCGSVRAEFEGFEKIVAPQKFRCILSGALTDVRLPGGDPIWAPYIPEFLQRGWLDANLRYTGEFYRAHPAMRKRDQALADETAPQTLCPVE